MAFRIQTGLAFPALAVFVVASGWTAAAAGAVPLPAMDHSPPETTRNGRAGVSDQGLLIPNPAHRDLVFHGVLLGHEPDAPALSVSADELRKVWQPFVGQPLTDDVVRRISQAIADKLPPETRQHVVLQTASDDGILSFNVTKPVVGDVTVKGANARDAAWMRARLGLEHGAAIDRPELEADVQAANTYPFRQVHVTLRNGKAADARDVDLDVTAKRPWEVYAGIKYATITPGPLRRYYFGGSAGSLLGRDSVLTWLWTGSQDAVLRANSHPKLRDLIVTYSLPVTRRGQVEAAFNDTILGFTYLGTQYLIRDVSGSMGYRWVLRGRPAGVEADLRVGVEAKHERTLTLSGVPSDMGAEAYQLFAGYHRAGEASDRSSDFDLALRISPGNVDQGNSNSHQLLYSGRPGSYAHYAYASLTYDHAMRLGQQWAWHAQVIAQAANGAVPYSEQPPVGGMGLVRGYTIFDGSFDSVAIVRNELGQAPSVGGLRPRAYAFFDYGVGRDISAQTTAGMASWGLGGKITVAPKTTLTVEGVETLRNGPQTRSGVRVLNLHLVHRL